MEKERGVERGEEEWKMCLLRRKISNYNGCHQ